MKSSTKSQKISKPKYEVLDYYLYEYTEYLITPNRCELHLSKFFKSDKPLRLKTTIKYYPDYLIETGASLLGAPLNYLKTLK